MNRYRLVLRDADGTCLEECVVHAIHPLTVLNTYERESLSKEEIVVRRERVTRSESIAITRLP